MFQTEPLLQSELLKRARGVGGQREREPNAAFWENFEAWVFADVKQQIEVKCQREDAGCSERRKEVKKHYR